MARLEQLYAVPGINPRLETRRGQRASLVSSSPPTGPAGQPGAALVTRTQIDTHPHEPFTPDSTPARPKPLASLRAAARDPPPRRRLQVALSHGHEEAALACYRAEAAPPAARASAVASAPGRGGSEAEEEAPCWRDARALGGHAAERYLHWHDARAPRYPPALYPAAPYPTGYTGHVAQAGRAVGQTYGRAVRDATNGVAEARGARRSTPWSTQDPNPNPNPDPNPDPDPDQARGGPLGPRSTPPSTHTLAFSHPARAAPDAAPAHAAHAAAVGARVGAPQRPTASDPHLLRVSTAQMSYPPPEPHAYLRSGPRSERTNPSRSTAPPWAESM